MNNKPSILEAVKTVLLKSYDFKGRARRSELWKWRLMFGLLFLLAYSVYLWLEYSYDHCYLAVTILKPLQVLFFLCIVPNIAVTVRRLHDVDKSGWYLLMPLLPVIGDIVLFVWTVTDSQKGDNKWGPSPKYSDAYNCAAAPSTPLMESLTLFFRNIISVKGRTRNSEFWKPFFFFYFLNVAINLVISFIMESPEMEFELEIPSSAKVLSTLSNCLWYFILVSFSIAAVRRLHDIGKDWKMVWLFVAPYLLVILFSFCEALRPDNIKWSLVVSYGIQLLQYSLWAYFFSDSQKGANQWGVSSKYPDNQE